MKYELTKRILTDCSQALALLAQEAIKTGAPKTFIGHLAKACTEIAEAEEIIKLAEKANDNKGSN